MDDHYDSVEWDERKSTRNEAARGFGFNYAAQIFLGARIERENLSRHFGERRFVTTGMVGETMLTVVWTPRCTARRIISARNASRREKRRYYGHYPQEAF